MSDEHTAENDAASEYLIEADQGHMEVIHEPCGETVLLTLRAHLDTLDRIAREHTCVIPPGSTADQEGRRMTHHTGSDEGRLSEAEREALNEPIYDADLDMHQRSDRVEQVVERILAARAAAPDALRERVEALREDLRLHMLDQPMTGDRDTYSDGYGNGLATAIQRIDAALADPTYGATGT